MKEYVSKTAGVGATEESDFSKFEATTSFPVFHGLIADIGLFGHELSYQIAYCYFNCEKFLAEQQAFIRDLPAERNSSRLVTFAENLLAQETALIAQIARIVPMLAQQSQAIPFDPAAR